MEEESILIEYFGDTSKLRIIDFFLDNIESDYSKKEIIEYTEIPETIFCKVWDKVLKVGILKTTRKYNKVQLYALNLDNVIIQKVKEIDDVLGEQAFEKIVDEPIPAQ